MKKFVFLIFLLGVLFQTSYAQFFVGLTYTPPTCNGYNDGTATATVIGGMSPYTYLWSNGDTIPTINHLLAGTYTVTVTDDTMAVISKTIIVSEPNPMTITIDNVTNSDYYPLNNGSIAITVTGGTLPYDFHWQDSIFNQYGNGFKGSEYFTEDINNIRGIKHYLHIIDLNECEIFDTVDVSENLTMTVNYNIEDSACFDASATSSFTPIIAAIDLPTDVFSSELDTITIVEILTGPLFVTNNNDTIGSYSNAFPPCINWVEFQTASGIAWQHIWFVDSADNPTTIEYIHHNIHCFGESTGRISFNAEGNYGSFTYQINGPNGTTNSNYVNNIPSGIYTLIATDQVGCKVNQTVQITEPALLQGNIIIDNEILCHGNNTGKIYANLNGGTGNYVYGWSNGETTSQINYLTAGFYSISVSDSLGCIWENSIILNEPDPLILSLVSSSDASYYDIYDGQIIFSIIGGNPEYTNYWQKDNEFYEYGHDTILNNIGTGTYVLGTIDKNGCSDTLEVFIDYTKGPLDVHLYEAFSPNGDGINDNYVIEEEYLLDSPTINIYTENNQHIYQSIGYDNPWDGTFNSQSMPDGKYVLIMQYPSGESIIHQFALRAN